MRVIDHKYKLIRELGAGFGGQVFLAEADGKKVALKKLLVPTEISSEEDALENFRREFTTLKELNHPHILRILDFGFDREQRFYYFTTEYVDGFNIFEATRRNTPRDIEDYIVQILRALNYLHSHHVYHLDIKPQNILIGRDPNGRKIAKLIDFGLSRFQRKGRLLGTPAYMAPEILVGEHPDGRADLYALGVTWYECLTGENPFWRPEVEKILDLQRLWSPPAVSTKASNIPTFLDPILEKLLRKNPSQRYHRAEQVIRDLSWMSGRRYALETDATALAYLPGEGQLIGRNQEWKIFLSYFDRVLGSRTDLRLGLLVTGPSGTGKSKLLKEIRYHAELKTIPVVEITEGSLPLITNDCVLLWDQVTPQHLSRLSDWMQKIHSHSILVVLAGDEKLSAHSSGLFHNLPLKNLDLPQVRLFIASVVGIETPPEFLVKELFTRSQGNPRFLTEILRALIESHQLFDEQGKWSPTMLQQIGIDFSKLEPPKTLADFCRAKFEALPEEGRILLAAVSLAKESLHRSDLSAMGLANDASLWEILESEGLLAIEYEGQIRLLNTNFVEWIPKEVDSQQIATLHEQLGNFFKEKPELSSYHLGFGTRSNQERFEHRVRYGEFLRAQNRWSEAVKMFDLAASIAEKVEDQISSHLKKIDSLFRSGDHARAQKSLRQIHQILQSIDNPNQWRSIQWSLREMGSYYIKEGRLDLARQSLEQSMKILESHEDNPVERMMLTNFEASILMREGKIEEAERLSKNNFEIWKSFSLEQKAQVLNTELPSIYVAQNKLQKAYEVLQEHVSFCREAGNTLKAAYSLYTWGLCSYLLGNYEEAIKHYKECEELSRQHKNEELLFHVSNALGNLDFERKDWGKAAEYYTHALDLAQHYASLDSSIAIAINLAIVYAHQGDDRRAQLYLRNVIDTLEGQAHPLLHHYEYLVQAYLQLGQLHAHHYRWRQARDAYRDAVRTVRRTQALDRYRFDALAGWTRAALELKDFDEAQKNLREMKTMSLTAQQTEEKIALESQWRGHSNNSRALND